MSSGSHRAFTCRKWKLNPSGCPDGFIKCKYSHCDTKMISPAINITCQSWKAGRCDRGQDECLFLHADLNARPALQSLSLFSGTSL